MVPEPSFNHNTLSTWGTRNGRNCFSFVLNIFKLISDKYCVENDNILTDIGAMNNEHGYESRTKKQIEIWRWCVVCNESNNENKRYTGPCRDIYASKEVRRFMMTWASKIKAENIRDLRVTLCNPIQWESGFKRTGPQAQPLKDANWGNLVTRK